MQKLRHACSLNRSGLLVHSHQLPAVRCGGSQKRAHSHLLEESGQIWCLALWSGCNLGPIVCQNPLGILSSLIIVVEDLEKEFMIGYILVLVFLELDLRAGPRCDALQMHWIRHCWSMSSVL